jgi:peptidoglycan lytic transglycosylase
MPKTYSARAFNLMRPIIRQSTFASTHINAEVIAFLLLVSALLLLLIPVAARAQDDHSSPSASSSPAATQSGAATGKPIKAKASWYGPGFEGHKTTSGQPYNPHKLTAASTKLPIGSTAEVKNLKNGREVKVKINDCGPDVAGRKVDLSSRAANDLKMKQAGVVPVEVKVVKKPPDAHPCTP